MPNWMTVTMVADTTNDETFDMQRDFAAFNDVAPMPMPLKRTIAGGFSDAVKNHYDKGLRWILANVPETKNYSTLEIARCYRAIRLTGYADWYEWSYDNWGVKWDIDEHARSYIPEDNRISFEVPWCFPEAGIKALSRKYPKVIFSGEFAEEQAGYFTGTFTAEAGKLSIDYDIAFSDDAYERYFALCGGEESFEYIDGKYVFVDD